MRCPTTGSSCWIPRTPAAIRSCSARSTYRLRRRKRGRLENPRAQKPGSYLGGSYGTRVLLRGLREQYLAAARDGKRIHDSLRQAVTLDPTLKDAYFGLGLYHYYAAIAPTAARVLRLLLLLPAGDRAGGLKEMEQTRSQGILLRGEADYQLHLIYLWYEHQPMLALRLVEDLRARHPHNPEFSRRLASVQSDYLRNNRAALQTYQALLDAAREGRVAAPAISEVNARLGMAAQLISATRIARSNNCASSSRSSRPPLCGRCARAVSGGAHLRSSDDDPTRRRIQQRPRRKSI